MRPQSINTLRKQAQSGTKLRGHSMRWFKPVNYGRTFNEKYIFQHIVQTGVCRKCDKTVHLDNYPPANGIDICGEAVALNCGD